MGFTKLIKIEAPKAITEGMVLMIDILLSNLKTGVSILYKDEDYKEYLRETFLESVNENAKSALIEALSKLFSIYNKLSQEDWGILPPDVVHLDILVNMIPSPDKTLDYTETYFVFLENLLDVYSGFNSKLVITVVE